MNAYPTLNHPADRLHVSNIGFKQRHVYEIALELSRNHAVALPDYFSDKSQDWMANWIIQKFGFDRELIRVAHETVRARIPGAKIYRKGRPPGSKNKRRFEYPTPEERAADADPFADLPEATHAAPTTETATTPQPTPSSVDLQASWRDALAAYALKSDLHRVSDNITAALKDYTEGNFTKLFDAQNTLADKHNTLIDIVQRLQSQQPTIINLERKELPPIATNVGRTHVRFMELLTMCQARMPDGHGLNIWVHGPAGTGKSTAAAQCFKALGLDFRTNGKLQYTHDLLGHMHGATYMRTQFRDAFENGHGYCADEIDSWAPDALVAINGALANGVAAFPDGLVKRHPNFVFVACANTVGLGATMDYAGRFAQDGAFMDRCIFLDWPIDDNLEASMCTNAPWLNIVRFVRNAVATQGLKKIMITPRATLYGQSLLAAGLSIDRVMISVLKKGMTDAQWANISRGMPSYS